jgi:hypothetical protein
LRNPRWSCHTPWTGAEGALIYVKVGAIDAPFILLPERNAQRTEAVICAGRNP